MLEIYKFWLHNVILKALLNLVEVFFHGCVCWSHLNNLDIIGQRGELSECFVYPLHKLWWKSRLHVFKLALQLFQILFVLIRQCKSLTSANFCFFGDTFYFGNVFSHSRQIWQQNFDVFGQQRCNFLQNLGLKSGGDNSNIFFELGNLITIR